MGPPPLPAVAGTDDAARGCAHCVIALAAALACQRNCECCEIARLGRAVAQ